MGMKGPAAATRLPLHSSVLRLAQMDTTAAEYEQFVRARTPALLRSAYLLTGDQHLAEDLVQEALARTHRAWRQLHATGNAEAYARKIMYHAQVSVWRRRRVAESFPGTLLTSAARTRPTTPRYGWRSNAHCRP